MKQMITRIYAQIVVWKPLLAVAFLIVMMLFVFALPGKALAKQADRGADQPDISITIIPATASFAEDNPTSTTGNAATVEVEVEVSNLTMQVLQNVTLCWFTNASINVNNLPSNNCLPPLPSLAATGQHVWTVDLTRIGLLTHQDAVQFRVDYQFPTGQNGLAQRYAFGPLTVQNLPPQTVQQIAQLTVLSSGGIVTDLQTSQIFLVIENKSNFLLNITGLLTKDTNIIFTPDDFTNDDPKHSFTSGKPNHTISIAPGQQITTAINIEANGPVPPGTQTLVFEVGVQWIDSGQVRTGNLVANQQVNVGVPGASEIVGLLGIPSLLVLPGFLMLATYLLFKNKLTSPIDSIMPSSTPSSTVTNPIFWLLSVTLSIAVDLVYFLFTRHEFWVQYDLTDIVYIWVLSIIAAIVLDFGIAGIYNLWLQRHTPGQFDDPIDILRKLDNQGLNLVCNYVRLKVNEEEKNVFLLERRTDSKTQYWVSPAIKVTWKIPNDPSLLDDLSSLQNTFNAILKDKDAGKMADFLGPWYILNRNKNKQNNSAPDNQYYAPGEVDWEHLKIAHGKDAIDGPRQVKKDDIVFESDQQYIVVQEFFTEPVTG